jgi:hypothetical protein
VLVTRPVEVVVDPPLVIVVVMDVVTVAASATGLAETAPLRIWPSMQFTKVRKSPEEVQQVLRPVRTESQGLLQMALRQALWDGLSPAQLEM